MAGEHNRTILAELTASHSLTRQRPSSVSGR
jgi:hypothetical protein